MIKLHIYRPAFGQPSGSPFCVKAIILLKMAGAEFETVYLDDPRKTPPIAAAAAPVKVENSMTNSGSYCLA